MQRRLIIALFASVVFVMRANAQDWGGMGGGGGGDMMSPDMGGGGGYGGPGDMGGGSFDGGMGDMGGDMGYGGGKWIVLASSKLTVNF